MPTYRKASVVPVEFEAVWGFHDELAGVGRLTPGWMDLWISQVRPDGLEATERLTAGTTFHLEIQPLNLRVAPAIERWMESPSERSAVTGRISWTNPGAAGARSRRGATSTSLWFSATTRGSTTGCPYRLARDG